MPTAIILVLVALGSVLFHLLSPWWWTPIASNWGYIDDTIIITFWITGVVFTAIILFMAYCVFRFRHQAGRQAAYDPENKKLEWWLTIVTAVGVAAMLAPGLFVWNQFVTVPARGDRGRGHRPAVAVELPPSGQRRPARHVRYPERQFRQPFGLESKRSRRARRCRDRSRRLAPADRQAGQGLAALDRRPARFLCAGVPGQDGYGARHGHLLLVHPHQNRDLRGALRRAVRCCALAHAGQGRRRGAERISGVAGKQQTFAQLSARTRQAKATQ